MNLRLKYDPLPENAPALAADIVASAQRISGVMLDYSQESVQSLDSIVESFRREGVAVENVAETLFGMGCYLGEVFVRNGCGVWRKTEETGLKGFASAPMVIQTGPDSACNPIDKVFKRMENGEEDSLPYFYSGFSHHSPPPKPWWKFWK